MMSPAFSSNASESLEICSATLQIILSRLESCRTVPLTASEIAAEMPGLRGGVDRPEHGGMIETLADFPRLLFRGHAVWQIAPGHIQTESIDIDVFERLHRRNI